MTMIFASPTPDAANAAESGLADTGQNRRLRLAGALYGARRRRSLRPYSSAVRQAEQQQTQGIATATGIVPGHTFTLTHAPNMADNAKWLVVGARYDFEENQYASGGGNTAQHRIAFTVIPAATPFVPASGPTGRAPTGRKPPAW